MKSIIAKINIYSRLVKLAKLLRGAHTNILDVIYGEAPNEIHSSYEFITLASICPVFEYTNMHACLAYQNPQIKKSIFDFKYRKNKSLTLVFGKLLYEKICSLNICDNQIVLIPIPPHRKRIYEYGFSQTLLLAEAIALHENIFIIQDILAYKHETLDHKMKKRNERLRDAIHQFIVPENKRYLIRQKHVIIIDDIITTGSTCLDAMRACNEAGATSVITLAVAH